jgi:hypothetical protein
LLQVDHDLVGGIACNDNLDCIVSVARTLVGQLDPIGIAGIGGYDEVERTFYRERRAAQQAIRWTAGVGVESDPLADCDRAVGADSPHDAGVAAFQEVLVAAVDDRAAPDPGVLRRGAVGESWRCRRAERVIEYGRAARSHLKLIDCKVVVR